MQKWFKLNSNSKSMKKIVILFCAAICVWVLLNSCNQSNKNNADAMQPKVDTVVIQNMKFTPDTISINKGDTLVFVNKDIVEHNIVALPDSAWMSTRLKMGTTWKISPTVSTDYFCNIHVVMKGRINVK